MHHAKYPGYAIYHLVPGNSQFKTTLQSRHVRTWSRQLKARRSPTETRSHPNQSSESLWSLWGLCCSSYSMQYILGTFGMGTLHRHPRDAALWVTKNSKRVCRSTENTNGDVSRCLCWKRKRESTPNKFLLFRNTMGNLKSPIKYVCRSISHSGRQVELFYGAIL